MPPGASRPMRGKNGPVADPLEITHPVRLCDDDGRLNVAAVGWTRRPLHTANLKGRGRSKRWEYWAISTPSHVLSVTVSDLDYAALVAVYFLGPDGRETVISKLLPLARVPLPDRCGGGPVTVRAKGLSIDLQPGEAGVRMLVDSPNLTAHVAIERPREHEALGVVVPWSPKRFQYTVKENTLPARGHVTVDGRTHEFDEDAWATLDHGRGRWPYRVTWNWGSGSGVASGQVVGVQVGGKWTDGTGSTENALCVNGRIHYIGEQLAWEYDAGDWMSPWRIRTSSSDRVDLVFTPLHIRADRINLGILANDTHQAFDSWAGTMLDDAGRAISVDGIRGWAEEVVNRW
jgi:hypothetical protein